MKGFKNYLNEEYANLYHLTSLDCMSKILECGYLESGYSFSTYKQRISFSRNKGKNLMIGDVLLFRLTFDKNKLATKYKLEPYANIHCRERVFEDDFEGQSTFKTKEEFEFFKNNPLLSNRFEAEERITKERDDEFKLNLNDYVTSIDMIDEPCFLRNITTGSYYDKMVNHFEHFPRVRDICMTIYYYATNNKYNFPINLTKDFNEAMKRYSEEYDYYKLYTRVKV